jgi:hypothetical protein
MTLVVLFGVAATVVSTSGWTWAAVRLRLGRLLVGSVALSAMALLSCAIVAAYWVMVAWAPCSAVPAVRSTPRLTPTPSGTSDRARINLIHAALRRRGRHLSADPDRRRDRWHQLAVGLPGGAGRPRSGGCVVRHHRRAME